MRPSRAVYQTLSNIVYPIFQAKIKKIEGWENVPRRGGFVIAANHIDWLDGFYIAAAVGAQLNRPVYFLTKSNNYWWTTITIQIPPTGRSAIVETATTQLQKGKIICNFPEGVRNPEKNLAVGKTGTARMAIRAGVPVVPLGIRCDAGRTMAQSLLYLASPQHNVTLRFGAPITFTKNHEPSPTEVRDGTERIMRAIAPLANKHYSS